MTLLRCAETDMDCLSMSMAFSACPFLAADRMNGRTVAFEACQTEYINIVLPRNQSWEARISL
jgi:hypothetical protein